MLITRGPISNFLKRLSVFSFFWSTRRWAKPTGQAVKKKGYVCCWCLFYIALPNAGYHFSPFKDTIIRTSSLKRRDSTAVSAILSSCYICSFRGDYLGFSAASVMVWRSFRQSNPSVTLLIALEQFSQLCSDWSRLISTALTTPNTSSSIYLYIAP